MRHQVTRQLMRCFNVLYVELPFTGAAGREELTLVHDELIVLRPSVITAFERRMRNHVGAARDFCDGRLARKIAAAVRSLGYTKAALVTFQFDFPAIVYERVFSPTVYLCNDDFHTDERPWVRSLNESSERELVSGVNATLAVSEPLLLRLRQMSTSAELFLPGHEFEHEAVVEVRCRNLPIRVCYMGYLNGRLRIDWLLELVRKRDVLLSLIGPIEDREPWRDLLEDENVEYFGALYGSDLQSKMLEADVFVMPYDARQRAIQSITAPNKLFQYFACGRPVVCTSLPSLVRLPAKFLYRADDASSFDFAVRQAFVEDDRRHAEDRLALAASNSWEARRRRLYEILSTSGER